MLSISQKCFLSLVGLGLLIPLKTCEAYLQNSPNCEPLEPSATPVPLIPSNRGRECFSCEGDKNHPCWEAKARHDTLIGCGVMGDNRCACIQYWVLSEKPIVVHRECKNYSTLATEYGMTKEEIEAIGCHKRSLDVQGEGSKDIKVCFCELDKCNLGQESEVSHVDSVLRRRSHFIIPLLMLIIRCSYVLFQ